MNSTIGTYARGLLTFLFVGAVLAALTTACCTPAAHAAPAVAAPQSVTLARAIIERRFGKAALQNVQLQALAGRPQFDTFEYQAHDGKLTVRGSSPIALTSGYYQFLRRKGLGMSTWAGTRLDLSKGWPETPRTRVSTPYQFRYDFNVVTYGYTMPYWTWDRWQQELDWMALHGVNMPLALVGTEAISARVWKKRGFTQAEIDAYFTGPAFLPWQRMGNVNKHNGPFPAGWNADQVALQHKILDRMRALGMEPIVSGFAGFVPPNFKRLYPDAKLHQMHWGGLPDDESAYLLDARSPQFAAIGKDFVQEWEKEFGRATYFLADSFNEMGLPSSGEAKNQLLADYGEAIYRSLKAGDPNAVWVIQGWMLGNQRDIWNKDALFALVSKVPDDKMLILDLAADYNARMWHQGPNWDYYQGFAGKTWIYSVIPNMGGKSPWTGYIDYYAKGSAEALKSPHRGHLVGSGFAPEGIENNEALYELLTDTWWRTEPIDLDAWFATYCQARYGAYPPAMKTAWDLLRRSAYNTFSDFIVFNWQTRNLAHASVKFGPLFEQAVEAFLSCADELKGSPLYRADALELAAFYLGSKAQDELQLVTLAQRRGLDSPQVQQVFAHSVQMLREADRLLKSHPIFRLQRWIDFARAHGTTQAEKDYYEADARRVLVQWGGGDYSARVWSGLIRDFYVPRLEAVNEAARTGQDADLDALTEKWIMTKGVSPIQPFADPIHAAQTVVRAAKNWQAPALPDITSPYQWKSGQLKTDWSEHEWDITPKVTGAGTVKAEFSYTDGAHRLDIAWVELLEDGQVAARDEHAGTTGLSNSGNTYLLKLPAFKAGAKYALRAKVRTDGGSDSNGDVFVSLQP